MATVVDLGMVIGKAGRVVSDRLGGSGCSEASDVLSPERFLTKICMVSSGSAEGAREEVEETLEMLLERMMVVGVGVLVVIAVIAVMSELLGGVMALR